MVTSVAAETSFKTPVVVERKLCTDSPSETCFEMSIIFPCENVEANTHREPRTNSLKRTSAFHLGGVEEIHEVALNRDLNQVVVESALCRDPPLSRKVKTCIHFAATVVSACRCLFPNVPVDVCTNCYADLVASFKISAKTESELYKLRFRIAEFCKKTECAAKNSCENQKFFHLNLQ